MFLIFGGFARDAEELITVLFNDALNIRQRDAGGIVGDAGGFHAEIDLRRHDAREIAQAVFNGFDAHGASHAADFDGGFCGFHVF